MSLYVVMKLRALVRSAANHSVVSLMAFVPLIRTRLMTRMRAMASACAAMRGHLLILAGVLENKKCSVARVDCAMRDPSRHSRNRY